jgi:hypothetical protein
MNVKKSWENQIRGWLPEEPKMPKSKLRRALPPIAILLTATVTFSLFTSAFMFNQLTPPPVVPKGTQTVPAHANVALEGNLQQPENSSFVWVFTNGSSMTSKNLSLNFSLTAKSENKYIVHIAVEGGNFFNETSVVGLISDGRLMVNSIPSIFLTKTELLEEGNKVLLTEIGDWNLTGNVDVIKGKPSTVIEGQRIEAIMVSSHQVTESGLPLELLLGYDASTGILVYSGYSLSDVLLKAIGIELVLGGSLELVSYSENLNLELINGPPPGQLFTIGFISFLLLLFSPIIALITSVAMYRVRKKSKRPQIRTPNVRGQDDPNL